MYKVMEGWDMQKYCEPTNRKISQAMAEPSMDTNIPHNYCLGRTKLMKKFGCKEWKSIEHTLLDPISKVEFFVEP